MLEGSNEQVTVWQRFCGRLADTIVDDNMFRGAWAEAVVHSFLEDGWEFSKRFDYYDLYRPTAGGRLTMSIKHSCGERPSFSVGRRTRAFEDARSEDFGWHKEATEPKYWCDLYVFAWIQGVPTYTDPEGDLTAARVLDPGSWRFLVASREQMDTLPATADRRSVSSLSALVGGLEPLTGQQLGRSVAAVRSTS